MAVDIDARLDDPHATAEQKAFNEAVRSHGVAMDASHDAEAEQYLKNIVPKTLSVEGQPELNHF